MKTQEELTAYLQGLPQIPGDDLESHCVSMVGRPVFDAVVRNYTEKQWGTPCNKLPKSIIARLPIRHTRDTTYFNSAKYQGMPVLGYSTVVRRMVAKATVYFGVDVDYGSLKSLYAQYEGRVFFSGPLDTLMGYSLGRLPYRSLRFEDKLHPCSQVQNVPVINDLTLAPHTRTIEHKLFYPEAPSTNYTLTTTEFPAAWSPTAEPYYPIRDKAAIELHARYVEAVSATFPKMVVGGRLGAYMYYDMDQVIAMAMKDAHAYK